MSEHVTPFHSQASGKGWIYSPGWNDRLVRQVEALPGPSWIYYLIAWVDGLLFLFQWWAWGVRIP